VAGKSNEQRQKFRAHGALGAVKFPLCIFRFSTAAVATAAIIRRTAKPGGLRVISPRVSVSSLACSPAVVAIDSEERSARESADGFRGGGSCRRFCTEKPEKPAIASAFRKLRAYPRCFNRRRSARLFRVLFSQLLLCLKPQMAARVCEFYQ